MATLQPDDPVLKQLRQLCLALPETTETQAFGHPNFKAGRATFVTYETHKGHPSIAFRIDPHERERFLLEPDCFDTPYGRGLWMSWLVTPALDWQLIAQRVRYSYRQVALKRMLAALGER